MCPMDQLIYPVVSEVTNDLKNQVPWVGLQGTGQNVSEEGLVLWTGRRTRMGIGIRFRHLPGIHLGPDVFELPYA